jgi:hypothetical protein
MLFDDTKWPEKALPGELVAGFVVWDVILEELSNRANKIQDLRLKVVTPLVYMGVFLEGVSK